MSDSKQKTRNYEIEDYDTARSLLHGMIPIVSRHHTDPKYADEVLAALHSRAQAIAQIITSARRRGRQECADGKVCE